MKQWWPLSLLRDDSFCKRLNGELYFGKNNKGTPQKKTYLKDVKGLVPVTIWKHTEVGQNHDANNEMKSIFDHQIFDNPKPTKLGKRMIEIGSGKDDLIMDFFAGSATTAHAVMKLNAEDVGNRKFIMVQLPELCDENSEAFKAGYKNISEIGKERIRRAGDKIVAEQKDALGFNKIDTGFRVFKVDSSNMKDVYYGATEYDQQMLEGLESNIKEDRTDLDLLYGILLDWNLPLSLKHTIQQIDGTKIHLVDEETIDSVSLIACFADSISEHVVRKIAKRKPLRVVFKDASFDSSSEKINVTEIFKLLSPNTKVKVI
jgi:adenine-specific DNA-methyltransferase